MRGRRGGCYGGGGGLIGLLAIMLIAFMQCLLLVDMY